MHPAQLHIPPLSKFKKALLIVLGGAFLLDSILLQVAGWSLRDFCGLRGPSFFAGHVYQLATFALVAGGLWEILFDGLILWFIGGDLERLWGVRRYGEFLGACLLAGAACFLTLALFSSGPALLTGPGPAASALCVAFGRLYPERLMFFLFFPLKAKWFATILVGINLYQGLFSVSPAAVWAHLGACACAFFWVKRPRLPRGRRRRSPLSLVKPEGGKGGGITYH